MAVNVAGPARGYGALRGGDRAGGQRRISAGKPLYCRGSAATRWTSERKNPRRLVSRPPAPVVCGLEVFYG